MRLRFLWINYYEEASKAAAQCYQQNQLPVPVPKFCLFPEVKCADLISSLLIPELLEGLSPMVGNPSGLHQLCISVVQTHFFSAVLPGRLVQPWTLQMSKNLSESIILPMGRPREQSSMSSPQFESVALDTPLQNNLMMIVISELLGSIGSRVNMCESPLQNGPRKWLSFDEIVFQPEKEKAYLPHSIPSVDVNDKFGYPVSSCAAGQTSVSVGCTHSSLILQTLRSRLELPTFEVTMVDETLFLSRMPSMSQDLYRRTTDICSQQDHLQLGSITDILETKFADLASKLFSFKFLVLLQNTATKFLCFSGDSQTQLWSLLSLGKASKKSSSSLASRFEKGFPTLELSTPLWEIERNTAIWSCEVLFEVVDTSRQCMGTPEMLDSDHSDRYEELIVAPELVYQDYVFSSLPIPVFKERERRCIATDAVKEALSGYKHSVPLALNFLYLDWHFSHKKDCGKQSCFALERRIFKVDGYKPLKYAVPLHKDADIDPPLNEKSMQLETKFSMKRESLVHCPKKSCSLESRESVCPLVPACQERSLVKGCGVGDRTIISSPTKNSGSPMMEGSVAKANSKDMFACNDLTFFLQARQGNVHANTTFDETVQKKVSEVDHLSVHETKANSHLHPIVLSESLLKLKGCLELDYCRILANDASLTHEVQPYKFLDKLCIESAAKAALILLIKERAKNQDSPQEQQLLRGLIALYVLQQTADNLCMYGIQVGHLYMESWYLNLRFLQDLVCFSYAECEEAYKQVEKGLLLDHPKLSCLGDIIARHKSKVCNPKVLVIAERRALFTLYKKIISDNLKPYQFDREERLLQDGTLSTDMDLLKQTVTEALHKCDCLMVPPEYITKSFPIKPFSCIIQYGHFSTNDEDLHFNIPSSAEIHTLKIVNKEHACTAGGDAHCSRTMLQESFSEDWGTNPVSLSAQKLKSKLQQELPMEASTSSRNKPEIEAGFQAKLMDTLEVDITSAPIFSVTGNFVNPPLKYKQCEMNIVVNINQSYNYLLSGQRSSYQRVLAFEKYGMNVVERDIFLPIDLILSPAVCLIWYTKEKLSEIEPSSSQMMQLSRFESITNDVMKALSFSFRTCIMVFEGQSEFLAEAMQMFGYLHAAAIGLDIQLQCFISGSSSTTDTIISYCILELKGSRKATSFPAMLEAKTFAESFLTEFASINALTAHAILSCGVELCQFMSLKVEEQLKLTESFDLTERSLVLFKQQCQNGSSGRLHKRAEQYHLNINQSKTREVFPASNKVSSFKNQSTHCKQNYSNNAKKMEWYFQTPPKKAAVDDFLHPDFDLEIEDNHDQENACFKGSPKYMNFAKGRLQSDSPVQKDRTPSITHKDDTKLRRTMDLILKGKSHSVGKEEFVAANGANVCVKSPADKTTTSSWFELDQVNLPNTWLCSPVGSVLSPGMDPGNTLEMDAPQDNDAGGLGCMSNQQSPHFFPVDSNLSPESNQSQELHPSFLGEQAHKKPMEVDLKDLFEYPLSEDLGSRQNEKECPVEFANETRAHLKRKLDLEYPAAAKRFKSCAVDGQKNSRLNFFDKYRHEGKEEQSPTHKTYSQRFSGTKLPNSPKEHPPQDASYRQRRFSTGCRSPNLQRNTYSNIKRCSTRKYRSPAQSKGLCSSWTPYDKRSKKVLSFTKKGNDSQSRLVWETETSKNVMKRRSSLLKFQKLF